MSDAQHGEEVSRFDVAKEATRMGLRWLIPKLLLWTALIALLTAAGYVAVYLAKWTTENRPVDRWLSPAVQDLIGAVPGFVWTVLDLLMAILGLIILVTVLVAIFGDLWEKAEENVRGDENGD